MLIYSFKHLFLLTCSILSAFARFAVSVDSSSNGTTIYDLLSRYGLPRGLLPDTVSSYSLSENGEFKVDLSGPCYVQFEYLVYYDKTISGEVHYGSIEELKGIQVRRFFIWFNVDTIKVDLPPGDYIYFKVGLVTKKLLVDQFQTVHSCRDNSLWSRFIWRASDVATSLIRRFPGGQTALNLVSQLHYEIPRAHNTFKALAVLSGLKGLDGTLFFSQEEDGPTAVFGSLSGFKPGLLVFHIHEFGEFTNGCFYIEHSGSEDHNYHAVNLGNVMAGENGTIDFTIVNSQVSLSGPKSIIGRAVVVKADSEDQEKGLIELSKATGNARTGLACGTIHLET